MIWSAAVPILSHFARVSEPAPSVLSSPEMPGEAREDDPVLFCRRVHRRACHRRRVKDEVVAFKGSKVALGEGKFRPDHGHGDRGAPDDPVLDCIVPHRDGLEAKAVRPFNGEDPAASDLALCSLYHHIVNQFPGGCFDRCIITSKIIICHGLRPSCFE